MKTDDQIQRIRNARIMPLVKQVLVAVRDAQAQWSPALAKATQLARSAGARVELFHCVDTGYYVDGFSSYEGGIDQFAADQRAPCLKSLEQLAQRVRRHGVEVTVSAEVDYPVYEGILRRAAAIRADLIVMDCHSGLSIAPSLLRLTDWEMARLSPVPVLIVKRSRLYHRPKVLAAVDPAHAFEKPLNLDSDILRYGTEVSRLLLGTLHAVHGYIPAPFGAEVSSVAAASTAVKVDAIAAADARAAFSAILRPWPVPVERRYLIGGHPADTIERAVEEAQADLVVMGSVARSGLSRLLVGNTADKMLYRLRCDLLLVKPAGFKNKIPHERRGPRLIAATPCS